MGEEDVFLFPEVELLVGEKCSSKDISEKEDDRLKEEGLQDEEKKNNKEKKKKQKKRSRSRRGRGTGLLLSYIMFLEVVGEDVP